MSGDSRPALGDSSGGFLVLNREGVGVVVDTTTAVPAIVHWGRSVGTNVHDLRLALQRPIPHGGLDVAAPLTLIPEHGSGYMSKPGLEGMRADGSGWAPRFQAQSVTVSDDGFGCQVTSIDAVEQLALCVELELRASGVLRVRATLTNEGEKMYNVSALRLSLPLTSRAAESLTFSGRWSLEFQPHRQSLALGSFVVENRSGKTGHDRVPVAFAGTNSFSETSGEVWGVHVEWSGNASIGFEVTTDSRRSLQVGELLQQGEITLAANESYTTPWISASYSEAGLTKASQRFHAELRSRPNHPATTRPVTLNIWEAVYFDHDLERLKSLADHAAAIGVERFVIDDGWFHLRRDDRAGLGDWWVDPAVWPNGLGPIADHVVGLGMQFGLWFEPECVNPDSDLYRAHPEWVLADTRYEHVYGRNQLVLDLSRNDVRAYLRDQISAVLSAYPISYVKWDMNRDLVHASRERRATTHHHTAGVYQLFSELRSLHPTIEFESCGSGGGRIDFGIFEHTVRAWTSDNTDPLDRQMIQRGFSHFVPPEYMGAHIAPPQSHTTRRRSSLAFRAATAFFGHLGIEWNILDASDVDREALRDVISLHKRHRNLLHTGDAFRADHCNPAMLVHGVIAHDRAEALVAIVQTTSAGWLTVEPVCVPGLDFNAAYNIEVVPIVAPVRGAARVQPSWFADGSGLTLTGEQLAFIGLQPPVLDPESVLLLHLVRR